VDVQDAAMVVLQIALIASFAWVAVLGLVHAMCRLAARADRTHDELTNLALSGRDASRAPAPRGLARSERESAATGVSLGV
jgi:hypothetical protein